MRYPLLIAVLPLLLVSDTAMAVDWRPVTASELAQKTPRLDPAADAEAVFWDVRIEDKLMGHDLSLYLQHYIRIKIYTDRGKEKYATVEIEQAGKRSISDIAGRTIKPDGTILELRKDAIFDRQLVKTKGFKVRGKTFALPNVEAGDMIEYRYTESRENEISGNMRLYFQRDIPMWKVAYHLKPLNVPYLPWGMRTLALQFTPQPFQKETNGYYVTSMTDMAAFQEEPNMPPEDQLRAWMLIYYEEDKKIESKKFWEETGRDDFKSFKPRMGANGDVKRAAEEIVSGAKDPQEQLALLDNYCRTKIENLSAHASRMTAEQLKAQKENHSASDTLKHKAGDGMDVDLLFAAMANAAGFDARMARLPDRGDTFFNPASALTYFIRSFSVAVKVNDQWLFYDPSTPNLERGMLRWQEEGVQALISDPKAGFFANTQFSAPARSTRLRRATFRLLDDGSLDGAVQYTYSGHVSAAEKKLFEDMTPAQREEDWKKTLQARLSTAEMSEFEMQNVDDPVKPVAVKHKVTVPGYATRTGKRFLLQPAFFQRNLSSRFNDSRRKWPVYFDYGWAEDDEVRIELPPGWELDQPVKPVSTKLGQAGNYAVEVLKTVDGRTLIYKRRFDWGRDMGILYPATAYAQIRKIFDFVQEQDNYTIALKAVANVN